MASGDDFVSGCVVKRVAKRMHNAGGCVMLRMITAKDMMMQSRLR